ncbi:MAG TPA: hypothetical protein PLY87_30620, partial [Planctomycetaceae bacterium]|nr:hypothetical protein [Planctomycetaceae bacterium]
MTRTFLITVIIMAGGATSTWGQKKTAPVREDIPYGGSLDPRMEEPIFAVCSKQGMRILASRDDGKTWSQTFLGTDSLEDGGWHGTFAVYEEVNAVRQLYFTRSELMLWIL